MYPEDTLNDEEYNSSPTSTSANYFIIPGAIIVGFALIAGAIFFSGSSPLKVVGSVTSATAEDDSVAQSSGPRPVDEDDHIRGNPNAPIVIVEYSDFDCPFCKKFHETMKQVMTDYGSTGQVAWVYRHFPMTQIHPNAANIAAASECVAELGGNNAFWLFTDLVFDGRTGSEPTNVTKLSSYAGQVGIDEAKFNNCLSSGTFVDRVNEDFVDGTNLGVKGTPYSLVLIGGQQGVINGAQPYEAVKQIIDTLLTQIGIAE